ncbi:MAG TPA: conjugal transfer protein TraB, partial [Rickettsia endosymbiont of Bembidion nr. Transversale]|nr:conjugal transfer protein TraB [Rickettsia endosymbiont of Bembidion nr. Transversale]
MDQDFNKQEEVQGKVEELPSAFSKRLSGLIEIIKNRPLVTLACLGVIMVLIFYGLSESEVKTSMFLAEDRQSREEISGIEQAIDPRAKWTAEILNEVKNMQNHLEKLIENKYLETKTKIDDFSQKLESLEKPHEETILYDGNDFNNNHKIEDLLDNNLEQSIAAPTAPVKRLLGYIKRADVELKKDVKDYITTGSFARGVLLTGVVVGTGTNNAASPEPIMIRLVDTAIFSKGYTTEQI